MARALHLLTEARELEKSGDAEAALNLARRAQSVLKTAEHTTGARWPVNEENPAQYLAAVKERTGVTDEARFSSATAKEAESATDTAAPLPSSSSTATTPLPSQAIAGKLVLDWGNRTPARGVTLTSGTQTPQEQTTPSHGAGQSGTVDESGLMFQQLDRLETWTSTESPTALNDTQTQAQPPLIIPGLIDRPDAIDDHNVETIPTGLTDSVAGSSTETGTTTIPVVPSPSDRVPTISISKTPSEKPSTIDARHDGIEPTVYDQSPRLLAQPDTDVSTRVNAESADSDATIWQLASAQLVSTFLGILLAIAAFLLIRAAASKLFGTRLGVTFQFGSGRSGVAAQSPTHVASTEESADVVPFNGQSSQLSLSASENQLNEPKRAGGVANPEDFPFRVVGTSNGTDEHILEAQAHQDQDSAILQSVFEHNVNLLDTLDKNTGSAA